VSDTASQGADAGIGALRRTLSIANKRGLHARAAAKFVRSVGQFDATVRVSFKGQEVSGLSIMGLMMLAAGIGSEIELSCAGRQAAEAMAALSALVESKFGED
jgi:phosphocarrier protein HPr